ncbi:MAG TPA: GNAT family N-acetyltransferase [Hyphomicrobiales bacterium]|nr:GNAT family N-acetyltransferase [Hyphomicrobiales bacterium]
MGKLAGQKAEPEKPTAKLTRPAKLKAGHIISKFDCGEDVLNVWLQKRALIAIAEQTAMTFAVCRGRTVVGYYSLAASSISHEECTSSLQRNTPDPVPAMLLARLAVHKPEQGHGIGPDLIQDAFFRVLRVAKNVAAKTLIVHALDEERAKFYRKLGFSDLPAGNAPISLHLPLKRIAAAVAASNQAKAAAT